MSKFFIRLQESILKGNGQQELFKIDNLLLHYNSLYNIKTLNKYFFTPGGPVMNYSKNDGQQMFRF